jgi:hypothetical protein
MEHAAHMEENKNPCKVLVGIHEGKSHLKDGGIDGRTLKWILQK